MQPEQVPIEGRRAKQPISLLSAHVVTFIAAILPVRLRVVFTFIVNFFYNNVYASARLAVAFLGRAFLSALIFLVYWLVIGPSALLVQLMGYDYLREKPREGSLWELKEPADATEDRFERQF